MKKSLRQWRDEAGLTQSDLAHAVGAHASHISNYEHGRYSPNPKRRIAIWRALKRHVAVPSVEDIDFNSVIP